MSVATPQIAVAHEPVRTQVITNDLKIGLGEDCVWNADKIYIYRNVCVFLLPLEVKMVKMANLCKVCDPQIAFILLWASILAHPTNLVISALHSFIYHLYFILFSTFVPYHFCQYFAFFAVLNLNLNFCLFSFNPRWPSQRRKRWINFS